MMTEMTDEEESLPRAALMLRLSGEVTRRLLFRGVLRGRQLSNGRWVVTRESIAEAQRHLAAEVSAPAA
jgi:hypothetical protein